MIKYKRLDEVCCLNMGQSPDSKSYNDEGDGLPFFQGNADFGDMHPHVRMWCSEPTKIVEAGTLLISVRAPIGALNFASETSCIGRGLAGITAKEDIDLKYVYYCLKGKHSELNSKGTGSTFKAINKAALGETQVRIIPKIEQQKVVETIDCVAAIIAKRKEQLAELDTLIKARFVEMFGEPESNTKRWPEKKMSDLCTVSSSKRILQSEQCEEGIPFLRVSDLVRRMDTGELSADLHIPEVRYADLCKQGQVPAAGDILVTSRGTLGRCYIWDAEDRFYFQDGMISWLSNYSNEVIPLYLSYLFSMPGFRKQIDRLQAGSTVAYLSIAMIKQLVVMLPDVELQEQFAAFVAQVDKSKVAVQKALDEAQTLFDSLMQKYFG